MEDRLDKFLHRGGAYKYLDQDLVLFGEDGAQVEQNSSFVDPCQHRRLSRAQTSGKLVGAKTIACEGNQSCGQGRRGRRPASDERLAFGELGSQMWGRGGRLTGLDRTHQRLGSP